MSTTSDEAWWKSAVVYQVCPRSFADSDGDGIGDLPGVLVTTVHEGGMKLIMDLVVNHTSSQRPWFTETWFDAPTALDGRFGGCSPSSAT